MPSAPSDHDLAVKLKQAIDAYNGGWRTVDDELYALCRRRNRPGDFSDAYTKVAVINRVYAAGVARSWRGGGDAETETAKVLASMDVAELIVERLQRIGPHPFDRCRAGEIVELHGHVTRAISRRSGNVFLTSFVSKYLHFHCPIVPIYDTNAQSAVRTFLGRRRINSVGKELAEVPESVWAYRNYVTAFVELYERVCAETTRKPSVKEIDRLLWISA